MRSLFRRVLLALLSFIYAGDFPLDALALLPLVMRRKVFLLLPIVDLHRLELHHPTATEGIDMAKVWTMVLAKRVCQEMKWLIKSQKVQVVIAGEDCYLKILSQQLMHLNSYSCSVYNHVPMRVVWRVLYAVPLAAGHLAKGKTVSGLELFTGPVCLAETDCQDCKRQVFYYSPSRSPRDTYLEAFSALTEIFPVEIDSTLVIGTLAGLNAPPFNVTDPKFRLLLQRIHTLKFTLTHYSRDRFQETFSLHCAGEFLESFLSESMLSKDFQLQNLHLCMECGNYDSVKLVRYYNMVTDIIISHFSLSDCTDAAPCLSLKGLKIKVKPANTAKLVNIVAHQENLERLDIVSSIPCRRPPNPAYEALLKAVVSCFDKPGFRCLNLEDLCMSTSTFLDVQEAFLSSTASKEQQLVMKGLRIDSSELRRSLIYPSQSSVCTKSLSVIKCSVIDPGVFSTADIVSSILSHPGYKSVDMSHSLDRIDIFKLALELDNIAGTLTLLNLTGCNLSSVITRAGVLFRAIFSLPRLAELELVLERCSLRVTDLEQLYLEWEKGNSGRRGRRRAGRVLRKLCICGNSLPEDKSNLESMARSLCY